MYVELTEGGPSAEVQLSNGEARRLRLAAERWRKELRLPANPLGVEEVGDGVFSICAVDVAGFVKVGEVSIDIAPKFLNRASAGDGWRSAMWRFLAYGEGQELQSDAASGAIVRDGGIADVLSNAFFRSVARGQSMGFPLGYRSVAEESAFMRGRLDQKQLDRLTPFRGTVPVITSRLSRDVALNRLLKWAALRLGDLVEGPDRRKRLLSWVASMGDVSATPPPIKSVRAPKREYPHLVPAVEIALVLLADQSGSFGEQESDVPGFLWNSDHLFERAMLRLTAAAARPLGLAAAKRQHALLLQSLPTGIRSTTTTPDIDVFEASRCVMVIDAKYKVPPRDPSSDDTYQVLAAGRIRETQTVGLIYPSSKSGLHVRVPYEPVGRGNPREVFVLEAGLLSFLTKSSTLSLQAQMTDFLRRCAADASTGVSSREESVTTS